MPFESHETNFSNKTYANFKKLHTFFMLCRSSILNLLYLCNFGSLRSKISSCGIPKSLLSNPTNQTKIRFFKKKLCQISHNALTMDWFSRAKLYRMPQVTVSTFVPQIATRKTTICAFSATFYRIQNRCLKRKL